MLDAVPDDLPAEITMRQARALLECGSGSISRSLVDEGLSSRRVLGVRMIPTVEVLALRVRRLSGKHRGPRSLLWKNRHPIRGTP
jgi:hypothetical protein